MFAIADYSSDGNKVVSDKKIMNIKGMVSLQ